MRYKAINETRNNRLIEEKSINQVLNNTRLYIQDYLFDKKGEILPPLCDRSMDKNSWDFTFEFYGNRIKATLTIVLLKNNNNIRFKMIGRILVDTQNEFVINKLLIESIGANYNIRTGVDNDGIIHLFFEPELITIHERIIDSLCKTSPNIYDKNNNSSEIVASFILNQLFGFCRTLENNYDLIFKSRVINIEDIEKVSNKIEYINLEECDGCGLTYKELQKQQYEFLSDNEIVKNDECDNKIEIDQEDENLIKQLSGEID